MPDSVRLELEAPDRWVYLVFDDRGVGAVVTREEWETAFRPGPEDQA